MSIRENFKIAVFVIMLGLVTLLTVTESYAAQGQDMKLSDTYVDFGDSKGLYHCTESIYTDSSCTEMIVSAKSDDSSVALPMVSNNHVILYAIGEGETTVFVRGDRGTEIPVSVKVSSATIQHALSFFYFNEGDFEYGASGITIHGLPGAKITMKVGKDKYQSYTIPNNGCPFAVKTIKYKKRYNPGTNVTVTLTKDSSSFIKTHKLFSLSLVETVSAKKKYAKVRAYNVYKGDMIKLTIGGKSYTKKIKKNYRYKFHTFKIKTKKIIKKNAKFKVVLKSRGEKILYSKKDRLYNRHCCIENVEEYCDIYDRDVEGDDTYSAPEYW